MTKTSMQQRETELKEELAKQASFLSDLIEQQERETDPEKLDDINKKISFAHDKFDATSLKIQEMQSIQERSVEHMQKKGVLAERESKRDRLVNHRGKGWTMLNKADKFSHSSVQNGLGHLVRAKICGIGHHTPAIVAEAMRTGDNTLGGFLVPHYLSGSVVDLARAQSVLVRAGIQVARLESGDSNVFARIEDEPTPEVKSELGTGDGQEAFTSQAYTIGGTNLVPRTVGFIVECSRELAEDAPNFVRMIEAQMARTMAVQLDKYGLVGMGGSSAGLLTYTEIEKTTGVGAIQWTDLSGAVTDLRELNYEPNAIIMHPSVHDAVMNTYATEFGWVEAPPSIRGKEFYHTTNCDSGKAIIGDFSKFMLGIRTDMRIEVSTEAGEMFEKHGVRIKVTVRADYGLLDKKAFHRLEGVTAS